VARSSTAGASSTLTLPVPDYEADDVLIVAETEQLRALADERRTRIVTILRERARSTSELADELGLPKGTVGHHLKVLEKAGLIRVVRTRKVRALTEKFYGRVARLYVIRSSETLPDGLGEHAVASSLLRQAADELGVARAIETSSLVHARLSAADVRRFRLRLERLVEDIRARESADGSLHGLVVGLYPTEAPRG
jgi:DNA-binding transcriptional ArsR family regulator